MKIRAAEPTSEALEIAAHELKDRPNMQTAYDHLRTKAMLLRLREEQRNELAN